jgi:hypothetical protein
MSTLLLFFAFQTTPRVAAQDSISPDSTSSANNLSADVPSTLTVKMPATIYEFELGLAAVVNTEMQLRQDVSYTTELFGINEWSPLLNFLFKEPSKVGPINIKRVLLGEIKYYNSYQDVLGNTTIWKNIPLNEDAILRLKSKGIHFFIAEVQFTNGILGIYTNRFNIEPTPFSQQLKENSDPRMISYSPSNELRNDTNSTLSQAEQKIACDTLKIYGYEICGSSIESTELVQTSSNISKTNEPALSSTIVNDTSSLTPFISSEGSSDTQTNDTTPTSNASASQGEWKTHSDRTLGIEFQYPPDWEVKEKTNRFEEGPDVTVEEMRGPDSFGVTTVDDLSSDLVDAELFASVGQKQLLEGVDTRLIEGVEEHTPIDGEEAYSFTYTKGSELGFLEAVQEGITVIHDDRGYILAFTGTTSTFDDPENVDIRDRILGSLHFLDGGESDSGEDEDPAGDEEEGENEEDNDGGDEVRLFN